MCSIIHVYVKVKVHIDPNNHSNVYLNVKSTTSFFLYYKDQSLSMQGDSHYVNRSKIIVTNFALLTLDTFPK